VLDKVLSNVIDGIDELYAVILLILSLYLILYPVLILELAVDKV
jgi:hypothetical protein